MVIISFFAACSLISDAEIDDKVGAEGSGDCGSVGIWYADVDGDGYGDLASAVEACEAPVGFVADAQDCDDTNAAYKPGATEDDCTDPADYNCDGSSGYADGDGDGFAACEECDDGDQAEYPGAVETCDGDDDDCDGDIDEDDAVDAAIWYADVDGDGYGDADSTSLACDAPAGFVGDATDCDDGEGAYNPGADETCDFADNDCDGVIDEDDAIDAAIWYADVDEDGYGDVSSVMRACDVPAGFVGDATDCDDGEAEYNPAADETCDTVDNNCDGEIDEDSAIDAVIWYADVDGDGYGDVSSTMRACDAPAGFVGDATDCDDASGEVFPGADETCDQDDDGLTDEEEATFGTDPLDSDTDDDGLTDGEEVLVHTTDPLDADTDDGGVNDGDEVATSGTDPLDPADDVPVVDDDDDGLTDEEEATFGTDPLDSDTDDDGLTDGEEVLVHTTDPLDADTDDGGVNDGDEVATGTDPLDPADDVPV